MDDSNQITSSTGGVERHRMTFAPGVLDALLNDQREHERSESGGYRHFLGDMDIGQAGVAHAALLRLDIDHTSPAGYVAFRTGEQMLNAIERLSRAEPTELGWKWRTNVDPPPPREAPTPVWIAWRMTQPIEEKYRYETSLDQKRTGLVAVFFDDKGVAFYATPDDFEPVPEGDNNYREALIQVQNSRWKEVDVEGTPTVLGYSRKYMRGFIAMSLRDIPVDDTITVKPTEMQYEMLRVFMGQPASDGTSSYTESFPLLSAK